MNDKFGSLLPSGMPSSTVQLLFLDLKHSAGSFPNSVAAAEANPHLNGRQTRSDRDAQKWAAETSELASKDLSAKTDPDASRQPIQKMKVGRLKCATGEMGLDENNLLELTVIMKDEFDALTEETKRQVVSALLQKWRSVHPVDQRNQVQVFVAGSNKIRIAGSHREGRPEIWIGEPDGIGSTTTGSHSSPPGSVSGEEKPLNDLSELKLRWVEMSSGVGHFSRITGTFYVNAGNDLLAYSSAYFLGNQAAVTKSQPTANGIRAFKLVEFGGAEYLIACGGKGEVYRLNPETLEVLQTVQGIDPAKASRGYGSSVRYNVFQQLDHPTDHLVLLGASVKTAETSEVRGVLNLESFELLDPAQVAGIPARIEPQTISRRQDPLGRFCVVGKNIYDRSSTVEKKQLGLTPPPSAWDTATRSKKYPDGDIVVEMFIKGFIQNGKWLVGFRPWEAQYVVEDNTVRARPATLCIVSSNTFQIVKELSIENELIGRVPTPAQVAAKPSAARTRWRDFNSPFAEVVDNPAGRYFLLRGSGGAQVVPYGQLNLPDEPLLVVRRSASVVVDRENSVDLATPEEATTITLVDGPESLKIESGILQWKPDATDLGTKEIVVRIENGKHSRTQALDLQVTRQSINPNSLPGKLPTKMPIPTNGVLAIHPDGTRAVQALWPEQGKSEFSHGKIFNLQDGGTISAGRLPTNIRHLILDGNSIFVKHGDDSVSVFDAATFQQIAAFELRQTKLAGAGDRYAFPIDNANVNRYSFKTPLDIKQPTVEWRAARNYPDWLPDHTRFLCFSTPEGHVLDGVYYDHALKTTKLLIQPASFLTLNPEEQAGQRNFANMSSHNFPIHPGFEATSPGVYQNSKYQSTLNDVQLLLKLKESTAELDNGKTQTTLDLVAYDLKTNEEFERTFVLKSAPQDLRRSIFARSSVDVSGKTAYVLSDGIIYPISLTKLLEKREKVLRILPKQDVFSVKAKDQSADLTYEILSGQAPFQAELVLTDFPLKISSAVISPSRRPGQFTLRGRALSDTIVATYDHAIALNFRKFSPTETPWVKTYSEFAGNFCNAATGITPTDVPFFVRLRLKVTDAAGASAQLDHGIILEIPESKVTEILNKRNTLFKQLHN